MMRRRWSEDEDNFLRFAFEKRMPLAEMEEALEGRTKIAIRGRIVALGLKRNYPPREKDGLIRCSHCGDYKDKEHFIQLKDGKYYCYCNECKTKLSKEKYLKKKKEKYMNQISKLSKSKVEVNNGSKTRMCSRCNKPKDVESFPWSVKGEKLSPICGQCRGEVSKEYQEKRLRTKGF